MNAVNPRLFVVRQQDVQNDANDFAAKYQAITDHLVEVIRREGKLDVEEISTTARDFSGAAAGLRDYEDFNDRPNAFLFIKPSPEGEEQEFQTLCDLTEIADASMLNAETGAPDPVLASSYISFTKLDDETSNTKYQDLIPTLGEIDIGDPSSPMGVINANQDKFTKLSIDRADLNAEVESYGKELVEHVLAMHAAGGPVAAQAGVNLDGNETIAKLDAEQQGLIYTKADWQTLIDHNPRDGRFQIMNRLMEEATAGAVAADLDTSLSQVNLVLNSFLSDPDSFIVPQE